MEKEKEDEDDDVEYSSSNSVNAKMLLEHTYTHVGELVADVKAYTKLLDEPISQPKSIVNVTMRDYQLTGLKWLTNLYESNACGILGDEMGLGKTVQAISILGWLYENKNISGPFIIITPISILENWQKEIQKICSSF